VHGIYYHPNKTAGAIHFHPDYVHFKEWPHIFSKHNVTMRPPQNFYIKTEEDVHIHNLKRAFKANNEGTYDVYYDDHLQDWFHSVISRALALASATVAS